MFFFLLYGSLLFVNECFRATEQLPGTRGRTFFFAEENWKFNFFPRAIHVIICDVRGQCSMRSATVVSGIEQLVANLSKRLDRQRFGPTNERIDGRRLAKGNVSRDDLPFDSTFASFLPIRDFVFSIA